MEKIDKEIINIFNNIDTHEYTIQFGDNEFLQLYYTDCKVDKEIQQMEKMDTIQDAIDYIEHKSNEEIFYNVFDLEELYLWFFFIAYRDLEDIGEEDFYLTKEQYSHIRSYNCILIDWNLERNFITEELRNKEMERLELMENEKLYFREKGIIATKSNYKLSKDLCYLMLFDDGKNDYSIGIYNYDGYHQHNDTKYFKEDELLALISNYGMENIVKWEFGLDVEKALLESENGANGYIWKLSIKE